MIRKNHQLVSTLFIALFAVLVVSCNPEKKYIKEEEASIQDYLASHPDLNFDLKPSGLYYLDILVGTGMAPQDLDTTYVKYTIKFLDGVVFDTNVGRDDTLVFLSNGGFYPIGFEEAVTYMKVGGKALFLTPSKLAYGSSGNNYIAGYTPLLFDVELVKIKPKKK